ncbi:MAG: hypothetical protein WCL06_08615 [Bacteroidota bacterium]
MNQLVTYTVNPFYTIVTGKDSIQKFGYDNYIRMKNANLPAYAQLVIDTKDAWQKVFGNLETYDADKNLQQSFTIQLNQKLNEFLDKAIELEGLVAFKFKKTSGAYQEFYPHGRDEYHQATQENIFILMKRMIDGAHKYPTELGATLEAEFTTIRDDFQIIWDLQKAKKEDVKDAIPDFTIKVHILYDQLYKNMLVILAENHLHPEKMLVFFDETIVNYVEHIKHVVIQKNSKKVTPLSFKVTDTITLRSLFDKPLKYYFAPNANTPPPPDIKTLEANAILDISGQDAGAPDNMVLIILNNTEFKANVDVLVK